MHIAFIIFGLILLGFIIHDKVQKKHTLWRNFPILGHGRWIAEDLRKKMIQYFVENDIDGRPINREKRSVVYQRSKEEMESVPYGTKKDLYEVGAEWINHSMFPSKYFDLEKTRFTIGENSGHPYNSSLINAGALSFGALSSRAIEAINIGAKLGNFAQNTGEGGISEYHLKHGGDLIWQIGTGYFGCRDKDGNFSIDGFIRNVSRPEVKMIELKLSQGAKPGHGGILPAVKNTEEIAKIRGVEPGTKVISPPYHSAFQTFIEDGERMEMGLLLFIKQLRVNSEKPIGIKLCVGSEQEILDLTQAMIETKIIPDFITIDGAEGGTGAAPLEFTNHVGSPLIEGLVLVDNILRKVGLRDKIKLISSGKILTGFDVIRALSLGADGINISRGMMLALGCIHALDCNKGTCPTGITTHKKRLVNGLHVETKAKRIHNYHRETRKSVKELVTAAGLTSVKQLNRTSIYRRTLTNKVETYAELYPY